MNTPSILVIYTGGTIGSVPGDAGNPDSPRVAAAWNVIKEHVPSLDALPFKIKFHAMTPIDSSG